MINKTPTKTSVINLKIEKSLKDDAQKLAAEMGFSLSSIVNASLKQFVRSKELTISINPTMSRELEKRITEVELDWKKSKNFVSASTKKELDALFNSL